MYQKIIYIGTFILSLTNSFAQDVHKVDSLKRALKDARTYPVLWELAYEFFDIDNSQALQYAKEAFDVAIATKDTTGIIRSGRITGQILRRKDDLAGAITILSQVLKLSKARKFYRETTFILNALAVSYTMKAEYDKALEYYYQSLLIQEQQGDKKQISITLNNIGWLYYRLENSELALKFYLQSLAAKLEAHDTFDLDRLYINIGLCYTGTKDYDNAEKNFKLAFTTCSENCNDHILMEGKHGVANALFEQKKYEEAENNFKQSLELAIKIDNHRFMAENLLLLGRIALVSNDLHAASTYLDQIDKISGIEYGEVRLDLYKLKANFYTSKHDFERANNFQQQYSSLRDSIYASTVLKNINQVQTQFAQRENMAIIAAKDEVLELNKMMLRQQSTLNGLLGVVVFLISFLVFVISYNYKNIKKVNGDLAHAKQVIEDQNDFLDHQVQEKTKELIATNETLINVNDELFKVNSELDNFIYKTSHDIRGPLASLKGIVNLAMLDVKDKTALDYLGKLDTTAEKLNTVLTRLMIVNRINSFDLKPERIEFSDLLQEIIDHHRAKISYDKIRITYKVDTDVKLTSDQEMIRLIMENLIDNAIKFHNNSDRIESFVNIFIFQKDEFVEAHVVDNGLGISEVTKDNLFQMFTRASERSETGGIGLYLTKLATEKLGGHIKLTSTAKTTQFTVTVPNDLSDILTKRKEEKNKIDLGRILVGAQSI